MAGRAMMRIRLILNGATSSFWFLPSLISIAFLVAAWALVQIEQAVDLLFLADLRADGARAVLSTIAGGMMTVTSIVFSLTFVALTTMSSQFGPRLLTFFMNDKTTQIVFGVFIGAFVFALAALLRVENNAPPPRLALGVAIILAVAAFGVMIYFVHHVATSIQADVIVARLGRQFISAIERIAQRREDNCADASMWPAPQKHETALIVTAQDAGYLQMLDAVALARSAAQADARVEMLVLQGDFLIVGEPLMVVFAKAPQKIDADRFHACVALGRTRTPAQELNFEMRALSEVAVRALSPGVNDPNTAIACIHRLVEGLSEIARKKLVGDVVHLHDDAPRALERQRAFPDLLDAAFALIRRYARDDASVFAALIDGCGSLAQTVFEPRFLDALRAELDQLRVQVDQFFEAEGDRSYLREKIDRAREFAIAPPSASQ